ncbi:MAG: hypothetical protein J5449_09900 [Oscillospiraceae bacterium]|nr:hypothetical protein [Oscillospiraceae bacterium]
MKRSIHIFSILFALALCLTLLPGTAMAAGIGSCGKDVRWTLDDEGTLTISGSGAMTDYSFAHNSR